MGIKKRTHKNTAAKKKSNTLIARLKNFYRKYCPSKLNDEAMLLKIAARCEGNEKHIKALFKKLQLKYSHTKGDTTQNGTTKDSKTKPLDRTEGTAADSDENIPDLLRPTGGSLGRKDASKNNGGGKGGAVYDARGLKAENSRRTEEEMPSTEDTVKRNSEQIGSTSGAKSRLVRLKSGVTYVETRAGSGRKCIRRELVTLRQAHPPTTLYHTATYRITRITRMRAHTWRVFKQHSK